jgi:bifunctional polynucleotide phosphatase/kinase
MGVLLYRYSILLISNQALKAAALEDWKKKIPLIAAAVR